MLGRPLGVRFSLIGVVFAPIAVLLLISSVAWASGPTGSGSTLTAPFKQTTFTNGTGGFTIGCSGQGTSIAPFFKASTGALGVRINASSPACTNRVNHKGPGSEDVYQSVLYTGVRFKAPTGIDTVFVNLTAAWNESWNVTPANCSSHGTSATFGCHVTATAEILTTWGSISTLAGHSVSISKSNSTLASSTRSATWSYTCTTPSNSSCRTSSSKTLSGTYNQSTALAWFFTGFFNSSRTYVFHFVFGVKITSESQHTVGGSMSGGTAAASSALAARLISIVVT